MFREIFTEAEDFGDVNVYYNKPGSTGALETGGTYSVIKALKGKLVLKKKQGFDSFMKNQTMDDDESVMPETLEVKYKVNWKRHVSPSDLDNAVSKALPNSNYILRMPDETGKNIIQKLS